MDNKYTTYTMPIINDHDDIAGRAKRAIEKIANKLKIKMRNDGMPRFEYIMFMPDKEKVIVLNGRYVKELNDYYIKARPLRASDQTILNEINADDLISLTNESRVTQLIDYVKNSKGILSQYTSQTLDRDIENDIKNLSTEELIKNMAPIKEELIMYSDKGFIAGDIIPVIKENAVYDKKTYEDYFQRRIASINDKDYIFVTFRNDYGIAPKEMIQDTYASHPDMYDLAKIDQTKITKTEFRKLTENGVQTMRLKQMPKTAMVKPLT